MKKLLFGLIIFFSFTILKVNALSEQQYYIDATINDDGSMLVKEAIFLSGDYNGIINEKVFKDDSAVKFTGILSDFKNGSDLYNVNGIENIVVGDITRFSFVDINNFGSYTKYQIKSSANSGDNNVYTLTKSTDKIIIKIFNTTSNGFYIEYLIPNVIVVHNDIAELFWPFIDSNTDESFTNITIKVTLPGTDSNAMVFEHGQYNKDISTTDNQNFIVTMENAKAKTLIDLRILFNKDLVPSATKYSNVDAKSLIIAAEKEKETETHQQYMKEQANKKEMTNLCNTISVVWLIILLITFIIIYKKYDKERKIKYRGKYHREIPADYSPAIVSYLMNNKNLKGSDLSVTILSLIEKKQLKLEQLEDYKDFLIAEKNYKFINIGSDDKLSDSELYLKNWLLNDVGDKNSFTLRELKVFIKKHKELFSKIFHIWSKKVKSEAKELELFEKKSISMYIISITIGLIGALISLFFLSNDIVAFAGVDFFIAYAFIMYILTLSKKSVKGIEQYTKWKAFKNFLKDFGRFKEKELPEISLWEKYLVYAAAFGMADKVEKEMHLKMQELGINEQNFNLLYIGSINANFISNLNTTMSSSFNTYSGTGSSSSFGGGGGFGGGVSRF